MDVLGVAITKSDTLVVFTVASIFGPMRPDAAAQVQAQLQKNIQRIYDMDVAEFEATEKRWLLDPEDARCTDSEYRNRDSMVKA